MITNIEDIILDIEDGFFFNKEDVIPVSEISFIEVYSRKEEKYDYDAGDSIIIGYRVDVNIRVKCKESSSITKFNVDRVFKESEVRELQMMIAKQIWIKENKNIQLKQES